MSEPSYDAIIPADVRYSDISAAASLMYGEIRALSNKYGYCFANNRYFADLYDCSKRTIQNRLKELREIGAIRTEVDNDSKEKRRKIYITPIKDSSSEQRKNLHGATNVNNGTSNNESTNVDGQSPEQEKDLSEEKGGFGPPSEPATEGSDVSPHEIGLRSDNLQQAIEYLGGFDNDNERNQFLTGVFDNIFVPDWQDPYKQRYIGRLASVKNKAAFDRLSDTGYEWMLEMLFKLKQNDDFAREGSKEYLSSLPPRVLDYLTKVVSEKQTNVEAPDEGDLVSQNQIDLLTEEDEYSEEDFKQRVNKPDPDEPAFMYLP